MPLPRLSARPPGPGQRTNLGAFNKQVTLYTPGNPAAGTEPSLFITTWCAMRAVSGQEIDKAKQIAQRLTHVFTIPYQPGVMENMPVQYNDAGNTRVFQIVTIEDPDEMRFELRMTVYEINQNAGAAS